MLLALMGAQARVFVTRQLPGDALARLEAEHDVEVWPDRLPPPRAELLSRAPQLEGLLSMLTDPVDSELIDAAPSLRAISNYAVGVDNVDVEAATARAWAAWRVWIMAPWGTCRWKAWITAPWAA